LAETQYGNYLEPEGAARSAAEGITSGSDAAKILVLMLRNGPQTEADVILHIGIDPLESTRALTTLASTGLIHLVRWRPPSTSKLLLIGLTQKGESEAEKLMAPRTDRPAAANQESRDS
jgi:hypothetical protein